MMLHDGLTDTDSDARSEFEMRAYSPPSIDQDDNSQSTPQNPTTTTTIVDEAQEVLAQSLLMFLYADLRLLSATGRINTKFETLCIDSDRVPRTTAAEMAQLVGNQEIGSMNDVGDGVTPGQVMAILFVELRQEVLAQRRRVKEQIKKQDRWVANHMSAGDEESECDVDDDDDAGVLNKITDRKGRKEFETDMHSLIRSYNNMLAQDLKGIPEVKLGKMFRPMTMKRLTVNRKTKNPRPWMRGSLTQRLFSLDDVEQNAPDQTEQDSDDEGSKKSQNSAGRKKRISTRLARLIKTPRDPTDLTVESPEPTEGGVNDNNGDLSNDFIPSPSNNLSPLQRITEGDESRISEVELRRITECDESELDKQTKQVSDSEKGLEGEHDVKRSNSSGKLNQSKLFEIMDHVRGMKPAQSPGDDLNSLRSDPGDQSWREDSPELLGNSSRQPIHRRANHLKKELSQYLTNSVERYREDHVLHNKLIIPTDDYETFAGAEDVGNKLAKSMTSHLTTHLNPGNLAVPDLAQSYSDPERNMSENELLEYMTKCIQSKNVDSLDFMADFFRNDTISQTMVKSKAQLVWLQDWFPIKDCIYAISVDRKKKRVMVVFRGATTRADWNHGLDAAMKKAQNPVKDSYEGKKTFLKIHRGFYTYLFRTRKDTSTRKYDEIANKVYEYGNKMFGSDFTVTVNGYSLGGSLSILFGFYASTDDRFTQNGPVKIFSYGAPYTVGHLFADAFRHQEKNKKVQHARFYNSNDIVAHMPFNGTVTRRGSNFVHVGIDVKLFPVPGKLSLWGGREPRIRHNGRKSPMAAYWKAIKMNCLLNMPLPWRIKDQHGLPELQKRIARAILLRDSAPLTLDSLYEDMVYKKKED